MKMLDAAQTVFFNRELERIKTDVWEVEYADLDARKIFYVDNEGGPGIDHQTVRVFDKAGKAKIIGSFSDDLPRADASAREISYPVRTIGTSFGYTVHEIRRSEYARKSLDTLRAEAARRAWEEEVNRIAFYGDAQHGLNGLLVDPTIPVAPVAGAVWALKTPDQILADVNEAFAEVFTSTKKLHRPTRLLLPTAQYSYISGTPRSPTSDTTILQYIVNNSQYIASADEIIPLNELAGAGAGGTDIFIVYNPDKMNLRLDIPHELEFLPVQERGLEFIVPAYGNTGGLAIYKPLSLARREGI